MIEYLSKEEGIYVGKVTARQVVLNDGLLADCTFDLSREEMPFETIDKYKRIFKNILQVEMHRVNYQNGYSYVRNCYYL